MCIIKFLPDLSSLIYKAGAYSLLSHDKGDANMTVSTHMEALKKKHGELENQLNAARLSLSTDDLHVANLKRKKLHIKDEIEKLKTRLS